MASFFRRKVTNKVLSSIGSVIDYHEIQDLSTTLPATLRFTYPKDNAPKIQMHWKHLLQLKPELETRIQPQSLFSVLKNQDLLPSEGITEVTFKDENQPSFIFSLDNGTFTNTVLRGTFNNFEEVFVRSCFSKVVTPQRVVIDYSSPNMAKPFHYGHFRSTVIGNFIANILRYVGHDVVSINYIGDWGLQYGILAAAYDIYGSEEKLQKDALAHLYEVYQEGNKRVDEDPNFAEEARKYFQKMEEGDPAALRQWNRFKEYTLKSHEEVYGELGIKFDEIHGESMYARHCDSVLKSLLEKNIAQKCSDGSISATISNGSGETEKVFLLKSNGTTLYLTRDLAAAVDRQNKYHFHSMYYVVDGSQSKHFSYVIQLLKELGYSWHSNVHHVPFGRIHNFSTRKGSAVSFQNILHEAQQRILQEMRESENTKVKDNMEQVASVLGISALIINDLSFHRTMNYPFLWNRILRMDGDSGISLQYCHARLNNIKEYCGVKLEPACDLSPLVESEALALIHQISKFDEVIWRSYSELEPHILVHYLFNLKKAVNRANKVLTVKRQPINIARARLLLFHTAHLVLGQALRILGIKPLNKM